MAESIRFYADQHFPLPVTEGLRRRGVDITTAQDANLCSEDDAAQLAHATAQNRVLVTFDPDFRELQSSGVSHSGIVWCPATKYSIGELIQMLVLVCTVLTPDEMKNHLEHL